MKISLFLDAGASVPFGMPTTKQFKKKMKDEYSDNTVVKDPDFEILQNENLEDIEHVL